MQFNPRSPVDILRDTLNLGQGVGYLYAVAFELGVRTHVRAECNHKIGIERGTS